ncbi:carbohydrate-binding protein [Aquimarina sp. RZ0]|uniref:carbohydrate-binding protein n=1 Tax=Aquimarina sp. RZ0 TaxID=2607730 RepID=UPI0011F24AF8|nr:carbohydrate-binding protein [Aquimarina sp. RZ0]KAA1243303.1 carbohydrate-binding protein [Aquimarina sp. RZ0]
MKTQTLLFMFCLVVLQLKAQNDWNGIPVPADAGQGKAWELQEKPSDNFNYVFNATTQRANFGNNNKWYNFYHNSWDGPGTTYWQHNHVAVDGSDLVLRASRNPSTAKLGVPGVNAGCITSHTKVRYPVFVESRVSVADIALASDVWLLSPDDTQEIDIIECYGGDEQGNEFFSQFIHLSHHSFIRQPFTDYQPRDLSSWWGRSGVDSWGEWSWNNGNRRYVRIGVNWISPFHFEYYIDGELVRVLYNKAFATKNNGTWTYTYPTMTNGTLDTGSDGFQRAVQFATGTTYSFQTLQAASNTSSVSVIDPYRFQGTGGFTKEMDIIINVESQDWHVLAGRTPTDAQLRNPARNKMKVDWIRVYKPVQSNTTVAVSGVSVSATSVSLDPGETSAITATVSPANATNKNVTWSSSNTAIATVNNNGVVTAVATGSAIITARTVDGGFTATTNVTVDSGTGGGGGNAGSIVIEAETFVRTGGTFDDASAGGPGSGVNAAGNRINYVNNGDWAEYTINVASAGEYRITYQISTPSDNAQIRLLIDGTIVATDNVVNNGQWESYDALVASNTIANLSTGAHTVRVVASGSNPWQWNLDKITLTKLGNGGNGGPSPGPATSLIVQAEDFSTTGGAFGGFERYTTRGVSAINYNQTGDWAEYSVNITNAGLYNVEYFVGTAVNNAAIEFILDGTSQMKDNVSNNNNWDSFTSLRASRQVNLSAGSHLIRLVGAGTNAANWEWNMDRFELSKPSTRDSGGINNETPLSNNLSVYPNPTSGKVFIQGLGKELEHNVRVFDIKGAQYLEQKLNEDHTINIERLPQGIYFLTVVNSSEKVTLKLLKN